MSIEAKDKDYDADDDTLYDDYYANEVEMTLEEAMAILLQRGDAFMRAKAGL